MKRLKRRRRLAKPAELDITAFMNLMVILIPFLLITAVFSRITVLELSLPPAPSESTSQKIDFDLQILLFPDHLELRESSMRIKQRFDLTGEEIDWLSLNEVLNQIKAKFPSEDTATLLVNESVEYDMLVQTMDHIRVDSTDPNAFRFLFPDVAIGDAPAGGGA